ncbi:MAG TPA: BREX-6 system adenine-specific DNA-methyltransferase PglX, partial [Myxococcales bacterium]|nr:BREX-6 system adenine-specific DNA-methyltransferase PglX [Myxococcales bacterium]
AVKEASATLLNRLVLLRHLEALGLSKPAVVTGGWNSKAYRELRDFAPALLGDDTQGYETLLRLVFDELALDMPGLFGDVGLTRLFPVPAATLREVVERLDDERLESSWTDDTTLGWVYQYWNDPEREALDAKINDGGKIEPHEIASKTQMFTERYMVEWLLQNSLGLMWLCMCRKHGWTADAEAVLPVLDARRAEWRKKRDAGEVPLDALMPISGELEERWKYYVPQPIPEDSVTSAPESVRAIKLLDPACGSGHFLVIAFDLLAAMYREEARHRGESISDREFAESILENNLHGIDIDPRAVQIAAAAVVLKAKRLSREARPRRVNLVAPVLRLGNLPDDDPALVRLRRDVKRETGIPEELTNRVIKALAGVDHLGSLLKVDAAIDEAIKEQEEGYYRQGPAQGDLLTGQFPEKRVRIDSEKARANLQERLEEFLARHAHEEDLGLRLGGEQLAAGLRFVRMVKEGSYDLVVGNPPYQGLGKTTLSEYVANNYPHGKDNLYATFLERSGMFVRDGGSFALLTMRGWMFVKQFQTLRRHLLHTYDLKLIGDVDRGAFEDVLDEVLATVMTVFRRCRPSEHIGVAMQPTPPFDRSRDADRTSRKRAAVLAQVGRFELSFSALKSIEGEPIVYWWPPEFLAKYRSAPKLADVSPARFGLTTGDNARFTRFFFEVTLTKPNTVGEASWVPFVLGGKGRAWFEPLREVCRWVSNGLEIKEKCLSQYGTVSKQIRNEDCYFRPGIAFAMIGSLFSARAHRYPSIIGNMGSSVFPEDVPATLSMMNSSLSKFVLESLNPGMHFEVGDVNRLPVIPVSDPLLVFDRVSAAFSEHEASREASYEFQKPNGSPWLYAQSWAQEAIDRAPGVAFPKYSPTYESPSALESLSFLIGVALGRFGANGEGILTEAPPAALPNGILFVSAATEEDSLKHPACAPILDSWKEHGPAIAEGTDLRTWLRKDFFAHHKSVYENRPIYFPLSSAKKSFVAWVSIHRWTSTTLSSLLADHLLPERRRLEGELDDLRQAKAKGGKGKAERRFAEVQRLLAELTEFIDKVTECAERGPPPTSPGETPREGDARYEMDLDDGVMINSAALWPLLEPQWKDPKKWWKELATAKGRKDYDWAHLARRYFPDRVDRKCHDDPSLAVAHGCFWRL